MRKNLIFTLIALLLFTATLSLDASGNEMAVFFPKLEGFKTNAAPDYYNPETLYEYINGAADVFLSYNFQNLGSLAYESDKKQTVTIDIYHHGNAVNGFGIYSQEKPRKGDFLPIGTQGYYEKGTLNFLKGSYYVKISSFDLADKDKEILTDAAQQVAQKLPGNTTFPEALKCLPQKGQTPGSTSYISQNFLGHSFLHSAFVADYEVAGKTFQIFLIQAETEKDAAQILTRYQEFVKGKGKKIEESPKGGFCSFQDPYYRSSGKMNLKISGNYLWGLFSHDAATAESYLREIGEKLTKAGLIK